jgi:hypothetical protein
MNIDEVQRRFWEQSQAHKQHRESGTPLFPTDPYGGRIRNLMDLMHNPTWIAAACARVLKRSHDEFRIVWKAGCLETCTSGLGLESGCDSPAYTTARR